MPHDSFPRRDPDPDDDGRDAMVEDYLDCTGKKRKFRLRSYGGGLWLDATEVLDGDHVGMRIVMRVDELGHLPWGDMRDAIRQRLAERDVALDPDTGKLEILRGRVRAQLEHTAEGEHGPTLIVDDRRVTWEQLGQMLDAYEGWGLQLKIVDGTQE